MFAWTLNSLALTMLTVLRYWLIENQSGFTNKLRNAIVLTYDFLIFSEVIRQDRAPFDSFSIKKMQLEGSNLFLKYTTRTHSLSKINQYTKYHT